MHQASMVSDMEAFPPAFDTRRPLSSSSLVLPFALAPCLASVSFISTSRGGFRSDLESLLLDLLLLVLRLSLLLQSKPRKQTSWFTMAWITVDQPNALMPYNSLPGASGAT